MANGNIIRINGGLYKVGSKFIAKQVCYERGICNLLEVVTLRSSKVTDAKNLVGVYSDINHGIPWASLDGLVKIGHGLWVNKSEFFTLFDLYETIADNIVTVEKDFFFKSRNLKGMRGRIINDYPTRDGYFVELETYVGGGSADGMCGSGRCVVLPEHILGRCLSGNEESEAISEDFTIASTVAKKITSDGFFDEPIVEEITDGPVTEENAFEGFTAEGITIGKTAPVTRDGIPVDKIDWSTVPVHHTTHTIQPISSWDYEEPVKLVGKFSGKTVKMVGGGSIPVKLL